MGSDDLLYLTAQEQMRLFQAKKLSPLEVLNAQIARFHSIGEHVNAVTYAHFEEAIVAAKESEVRYRRGEARALEGITVALKDEYDRAGWITTSGSKLMATAVKKKNHPVVDKLLSAGAVLHMQTTAPEFYLLGVTWSDLWGVTRNPWNPAYTCGGSSGGSAAALAAGMTTLATGSDMGGSIRIPCALNGLYGFKPPYGRIGSPGEGGLLVHASPGPLARDFTDMISLHNVMSGPASACAAAIRPKLDFPTSYPSIAGWRIALTMTQGWAEVADDVRDRTMEAVKVLEGLGAIVEEVDLSLGLTETELRKTIEKALFSTGLGGELCELEPEMHQLTTYARHFVQLASTMKAKHAKEAAEGIVRSYEAIEQNVFQKGFRALVTPTLGSTRIPAAFDPTTDVLKINGKLVDPYIGWFLTSLFNLLNWLPVINVPTGFASNNVPAGMQIAAPSYDDIAAATVAAAYSSNGPAFFSGTRLPSFKGQSA